ncbi:uncharacterized protein LOC124533353 [Vanessa cardui]|uniref:uncharacterized protein LOC124533353 n=1 Tax=Vanessa cardui TaxID=171605 RepID=UPI001F149307|nr:uncharacterized protein LOC124533353 [Vanessa cardui]
MSSLHLFKLAVMLVFIMVTCTLAYKLNSLNDNELDEQNLQNLPNKEYVRHIHSMIDAYNGGINGKILIETNALIDTKYQTIKRNGDLINSLLGLPKGLIEAGR